MCRGPDLSQEMGQGLGWGVRGGAGAGVGGLEGTIFAVDGLEKGEGEVVGWSG